MSGTPSTCWIHDVVNFSGQGTMMNGALKGCPLAQQWHPNFFVYLMKQKSKLKI